MQVFDTKQYVDEADTRGYAEVSYVVLYWRELH